MSTTTTVTAGGPGFLPDRSERFAESMSRVTAALGGRLAFGGDYNPEQWPEDVWASDVALMKEAGVNLVSLGIFSWAWLEPKAGRYEFGWLDKILGLLHDGGIAVDLANASATPPPWFSVAHPDSLPVDVDGVRRSYGGRQAFCPSSPEYRAAAAALTEAIVARYADHPAVVMWHVHNEYGCHNWNCYCDTSAAAFRSWLQRRYGELEVLNDAWGTAFWSQRYYDWDEVIPPRRPSYNTFANPTQQLDFARFSSDELLDCYRAEAAIIRAGASQPVTTNFMDFFKPLDYWSWAQEMDLVSNDNYRLGHLGGTGATHNLSMSADLIRSLSDTAPWLLMEHSTSAVNWQPRNVPKAAGQMRRDSLSHVSRGADGALFFQWRASRAGAEKFHSALLPHAGTTSSRWREVCELGADLVKLAPVAGSRGTARIAIAFDWNAWWGVELDSHPSTDIDMMTAVRRWHRTLWEHGHTVDFVHPGRDLDRYQVVLVPSLYLVTDEAAASLAAVVARGGTVVVNHFSGIVDENDHIRLGGYPGAFTDLLGVRTEEFGPLLPDQQVTLTLAGDLVGAATGTVWTELIGTADHDVEVLATFADGMFAGRPAITRRRPEPGPQGSVGGVAWYLATVPDDATLSGVLLTACRQAGVAPALDIADWPAGLEVVVRENDDTRFVFALNAADSDVAVPATGTDLLTGAAWSPESRLAAGGAAVIAARRTPGGG
nr:beta-galactosidase [Nakamurella deserti]